MTGAGGYLGSHVVASLRQHGHPVVGVARSETPQFEVCDLLDKSSLIKLLEKEKPDRVVHCAWETPRSLAEYNNTAASERSLAMLDHLLMATDAPILYVSSMTVYGTDHGSPKRREEDAGQPESDYGQAKWEGEKLLAASRRAGFSVRLPGLFGGGRKSGLVWGLMRALQCGEAPVLPPAPLLWAAMDVRDAALSLAQLCEVPVETSKPVNIGYSDTYSVSRLVTLFEELTGQKTTYHIEHPDFAFDLTRARTLGVAPNQSLRGACLSLLKETL